MFSFTFFIFAVTLLNKQKVQNDEDFNVLTTTDTKMWTLWNAPHSESIYNIWQLGNIYYIRQYIA